MLQHTLIFIAACSGFLLSGYIWRKCSKQEKLMCIIGEDCNKVVYSRYAETFGIPNEIMGMLYYGSIATIYGIFLVAPDFQIGILTFALKLGTLLAAVFSWYLIGVQIFVLKEWCEWCIASSVLSTLIFILIFVL